MIPCPSPTNRNRERLFLVRRPGPQDTRWPIASDQLPNGSSREELLRQALQKRGDLVDAGKERRVGEDDEDDERIAKLAGYLRGKGMSEDDIRTACDVALGIGKSTRMGGNFGGNFGGALHSEVDQPDRESLTSPAARDLAGLSWEEQAGIEPIKDRGDRAMRPRLAGDDRSFEAAYGLVPTYEAIRPRRPVSDRQLALDAAAQRSFDQMFPEASRIRNYI
jgi:hypothetical protein